MTKFSEFNIKAEEKSFVGDKIKISKILNKEITILDYRIGESNYKGKCLTLQIAIGDSKHVIFTSSKFLIDMVERVPKTGFPFTTTIIEENESYQFT